MTITIFTDGASRGNPGHASYGYTISDERGQLIYEEGRYIGIATNNVAEYTAVLSALSYVRQYLPNTEEVKFSADSRLVVEQLSGRFKIKSEHLRQLITKIKELESQIGQVSYTHVYRERNKKADALANAALDKYLHG